MYSRLHHVTTYVTSLSEVKAKFNRGSNLLHKTITKTDEGSTDPQEPPHPAEALNRTSSPRNAIDYIALVVQRACVPGYKSLALDSGGSIGTCVVATMSMLNIRVLVFLLLVTFTRQGKYFSQAKLYNFIDCNSHAESGAGQSVRCSRDVGCNNTVDGDSVRDCCLQESILSFQQRVVDIADENCQLCYGMLMFMYKKFGFVECI